MICTQNISAGKKSAIFLLLGHVRHTLQYVRPCQAMMFLSRNFFATVERIEVKCLLPWMDSAPWTNWSSGLQSRRHLSTSALQLNAIAIRCLHSILCGSQSVTTFPVCIRRYSAHAGRSLKASGASICHAIPCVAAAGPAKLYSQASMKSREM